MPPLCLLCFNFSRWVIAISSKSCVIFTKI
nr:MAG TPA: hypothetical protein [Caudoviricetes sp.]